MRGGRWIALLAGAVGVGFPARAAPSAAAFLADLCGEIHAKIEPIGKARACSANAEGSGFGYVAAGPFVARVSHDEQNDRVLGALLKATGRRLARGPRETKK